MEPSGSSITSQTAHVSSFSPRNPGDKKKTDRTQQKFALSEKKFHQGDFALHGNLPGQRFGTRPARRNFAAQAERGETVETSRLNLILLGLALVGVPYWASPPHPHSLSLVGLCLVWSAVAAASLRWDRAELWNYRLSSFLGISLATVEGGLWLTGLDHRPGLPVIAGLHALAFLLAAAGRYLRAGRGRARRL